MIREPTVGFWVVTSAANPSFHLQGKVDIVVDIEQLRSAAYANARVQALEQGLTIPDDAFLIAQKHSPPSEWREEERP